MGKAGKTTAPKLNIMSYRDYLTTAYLVFLTSVFVLAWGAEGYGAITGLKYRLYLWSTLAYLGLLALISAELLVIGRVKLPLPRQLWQASSLSQKLVVALLLFCALSALLSDYPDAAWLGGMRREGLSTLLLYGGSFLAVSAFGRFKPLYIYTLSASLLLNCLLATAQMLGRNPLGLYPAGLTYHDAFIRYSGEFLGTVGNADLFSAFLCLVIPIAAVYALRSRDKFRWLLLGGALFGAIILLASRVAAGAVGMLGAALLLIPLFAEDKRLRQRIIIALVIIMLLGLALIFFFGDSFGGTAGELHQVLHGNVEGGFGSSRIAIWQEVLALVPEHLLLGGGPDTLGQRCQLVFSRDIPELGVRAESAVDTAHNEYLNWLVNCGLLSLAAYLAALLSTASRWLKQRRDPAVFALGAGLLCYMIQAFFSFSQCIVTPLMWAVWALLENRLRQNPAE